MISCGIIGYGKMGKIRERAIRESGLGQLTGVYDACAPEMGGDVTVYASVEALLRDENLDAVFICTPNKYNKPYTIVALEAGKHVFCEKPPAFTAKEVGEIIEVEKRSGKKLMYGFNHRHHASIQKMKQMVDGGEMGRILWMRGRYGKEVDENYFKGWRANKEMAGGGIMLDQGIHMLDLLLYLGGGFDEVQAMVSNLYWQMDGIEDNVFANLRSSKTGICASLHSTMTQWRYLFSLEVFLEGGALVLNGLKTSSGAYGNEDLAIKRNQAHDPRVAFESEEHIIYHTDESWTSEVNLFLDSIEKDKAITAGNTRDALAVMLIIEQIYSAK
ncbi:MAG: Gfo/Idh/MocA family oxidoreductase [Kiritimatiellae bacterium]|nr:Gfo/Idh/MocA family oxidoreductase [Kiritimatiellia bacterium]